MPILKDAITKVSKGTTYYGGLRAKKEIATPKQGRNMITVLYEGLEEQKSLRDFGNVNYKYFKFSPYGLTRAEFEASKNISVVPKIPTSL